MKKNYIIKLIVLLILIFLFGALLIISITKNEVIIDSTLVIESPAIVFLLVSAIILLSVPMMMIINLNQERKALSKITREINVEIEVINALEQATNDLFNNLEVEETSDESRFFMLTQIDENKDKFETLTYQDEIDLIELCKEFQKFSAHTLKLYYDIKDIRRFIGGLSVSQIMILQGMSGTGKTSLAYAFGEYMNNSAVVVPIQPMWKERTDLIGYFNEFTKKFNETTLFQKLYEAKYNNQMYIVVLDEMNIARVEYYFAEFLSLLELPDYNKRYLDVVSDVWENDPKLLKDGKLILPSNVWFVGTANNDDSTFAISDKVYDRAMVINLDKKAVSFEGEEIERRRLSSSQFKALIKKAQKTYEISRRNLRRIKQLDKYLIQNFQITFGNRIMQQIRNYVPVIVACGGTELDAIDDIMSKKVLRKLETKNMVYVKNAIPGLLSFIDELFGETEMLQCREYIQKIEINA